MHCYIDRTNFNDPAKTVAYDDLLLQQAKPKEVILRLWEPSCDFVVLGKSNNPLNEVYVDRCHKEGIPIIKRCSGGGTVFQSSGVINYAIVAPHHPPFDSIQACNREIMTMVKDVLSDDQLSLAIQGYTDLTYQGKKCCGNAQRRTLSHFLFHGSILVDIDLGKISHYLKHPSREPDYRKGCSHQDFLCHLPLKKAEVYRRLARISLRFNTSYFANE
ncbi:MAG: hypothetical protein VW378_05480 [bacterium]